jgi:transposase
MKYNMILDYFHESMNSSVWPRDGSTDSPFNTFTCKLCGYEFDALIFGSFNIGTDPYDDVKRNIIEHLAVRHGIEIPIKI